MNKDKGKFSKIWLLVPIWLPKMSLSVAYMAYMTPLLGNILTLSPPSPKRGKSLRMSLGIFTIHKKSPTCKKSALWLNLQSIWNGVPPRHTHGENRYSKSTGLIGLRFAVAKIKKTEVKIFAVQNLDGKCQLSVLLWFVVDRLAKLATSQQMHCITMKIVPCWTIDTTTPLWPHYTKDSRACVAEHRVPRCYIWIRYASTC